MSSSFKNSSTNDALSDKETINAGLSELRSTAEKNKSKNINSNPLKRKYDTELREFMEEMRELFFEFKSDQGKKFEDLQKHVEEIKTQNSEIKFAMETLSDRYDDLLKEVDALKRERKENLVYMKQLENKLENTERQSCASKIEIKNIPKLQNESKELLFNTVQKLCSKINLDMQPNQVRDIFRGYAKPGTSRPIVVDFTSVLTKEKLVSTVKKLSKVEKEEKLTTRRLADGTPQPIFISETLTSKSRSLFFLCRDFAKGNNYSYCWTSYGKVYLRMKEGTTQIKIEDEADLMKLKIEPIKA